MEQVFPSFWDSSVKKERTLVLKGALLSTLLIIISIWILLPIFYGSTYLLEFYFYRLKVTIFDFDSALNNGSSLLGPTVVKDLMASMSEKVHFTFEIINPATAGMDGGLISYAEIQDGIVNEVYGWAAVVINANSTVEFNRAILPGSSGGYEPTGAISIFVASARFFQVIIEYVVPFLSQILLIPTLAVSQTAIATALARLSPAELGNLSTTQIAAISTPFSFQAIDLRPIKNYQWSGSAPLEAGLIYFVIFAFHVTLFCFFARLKLSMIGKRNLHISFPSQLKVRFIPPILAYIMLSLWYSLINVVFSVPLNGNGHGIVNSQAGFMVFWILNFLTITSLGLSMEFAVTFLGLRFLPFFLITLIIINITSSFFPPDLMQDFYRYSYAMPFWHSTTADKYIFWGARNRLGLNFGVLFAWILINFISLTSVEWILRKKAIKQQEKERNEKLIEEKHPV